MHITKNIQTKYHNPIINKPPTILRTEPPPSFDSPKISHIPPHIHQIAAKNPTYPIHPDKKSQQNKIIILADPSINLMLTHIKIGQSA